MMVTMRGRGIRDCTDGTTNVIMVGEYSDFILRRGHRPENRAGQRDSRDSDG